MTEIGYGYVDTTIGRLLVAGSDRGLHSIDWQSGGHAAEPEDDWVARNAPVKEAIRQLKAYFKGRLSRFEVKVAPQGTPFQLSVWKALQRIPFGKTLSYGELAARLDRPTASRAVGAANGANPIPIIIPCHRVIGSTGKLTGFGGGLSTKQLLLELEGARPKARGLFGAAG